MATPTISVTAERAIWVLMLAVGVFGSMAFLGGMAVGTRDARLMAELDRRAAIEACEHDGNLAIRDLSRGAVICYTGNPLARQP